METTIEHPVIVKTIMPKSEFEDAKLAAEQFEMPVSDYLSRQIAWRLEKARRQNQATKTTKQPA